jgi:hypothetical protein
MEDGKYLRLGNQSSKSASVNRRNAFNEFEDVWVVRLKSLNFFRSELGVERMRVNRGSHDEPATPSRLGQGMKGFSYLSQVLPKWSE